MKNDVRLKVFSLEARLAKLRSKHGTLKALIARELKRPVPCSVTLQTLKRQRLRIKDEMVRCVSRLQGARSSGRLQERSVQEVMMGFVFVYQATYFGRLHHGRIEDFEDAILGGEEPEDQDGPDGGTPHLKLVKST